MSKAKSTGGQSTSTKVVFDPKAYVRGSVNVDEIVSLKTAFDLFDSDQGGTIDIKGNPFFK